MTSFRVLASLNFMQCCTKYACLSSALYYDRKLKKMCCTILGATSVTIFSCAMAAMEQQYLGNTIY